MSETPQFVAINSIDCDPDYRERFEELFRTRARAIDRIPGFISMSVLAPREEGQPYLVMSMWETEEAFMSWIGSPEFHEGHKRAFADLQQAKQEGRKAPMHSSMQTYAVLTN